MTYTIAEALDACGKCGLDYTDRGYPWHGPTEDCKTQHPAARNSAPND